MSREVRRRAMIRNVEAVQRARSALRGRQRRRVSMKLISLAWVAVLAVAGYAQAQTAAQSSPPSSAQAPAASSDKSSSSGKIDRACQKEILGLCGRAHGDEMKDCVKSGLDMNKFSDSCKAEIKAHGDKSSSSSKPST
jgi:hypothetical protein